MLFSRHVANTLSPFWAKFCWKKHCFVLARKHLANTKQGFFHQNWSQNGDNVLATCLEKSIINYSAEKKGTIFFFGIIFWRNTFEKGFQNYSSEKKGTIFFFGIIFW